MKTLLTVASLCGVSLLPVLGAGEIPQTPKVENSSTGSDVTEELRLLKQHLRPFESIAFQCTTEESTDGKNWKLVSTQDVKWDVENELLKMREERYYDTSIDFREFSNIYGKVVGYVGSFEKADKSRTGADRRIQSSRGTIAGWNLEPVFEIPLNHLFYLDDGKTRLSKAFNDITILKKIQIEKGKRKNSIELLVPHSTRLVINKSNGMIEKKIYESLEDDDTIKQFLIFEINESILKDGFFFPLLITRRDQRDLTDKTLTRTKVDVKSLEINKKYSLNDFSVSIPSGTKMTNGEAEKDFVSTQVINSIDIKDITLQFRELSAKAKRRE